MTFDPSKHLRNIKGKGGNAEYLDVKWRLVWLRDDHPDAITEVEHIEISPDIAVFKAQVMIPGGGRAQDYGSETPRDFGDYIEKAATKALGRALAQLGYGTQFVGEELDEGDRIVDSPVDQQTRPRPQVARQMPQERPNPPAPVGVPIDMVLATLREMDEDGRPYAAIVQYAREQGGRFDEATKERINEKVRGIQANRKASAPAPLSVAG